MKLSLVIPVRDDPEGLIRLLVQAQELAWVAEIIVVDDGSAQPCGPGMPGLPAAVAEDARLRWLRGTGRGAGYARNLGLEQVSGTHMLFFDSDDLFLPGMTDLAAALRGRHFDFCLFRHVDSRMRAAGHETGLAGDDRFWRVVTTGAAPALLPAAAAPELCRIAAYPWNKIYSTDFLRRTGIRCTEIAVHNDLALHWLSFLAADRILVSQVAGCLHVVQDRAGRLTNRRGIERLSVFEALETVEAALRDSPRREAFQAPFTDFTLRLCDWIGDMLTPGLRPAFRHRAAQHLRRHLPRPVFARLALRDPDLARRVLTRLQEVPA